MIRPPLAPTLLLFATAVWQVGCRGCAEPEETVTLAEASDEVVFASVEHLGPHRYIARTTTVELRDGAEVSTRRERVRIQWTSRAEFRYRRTVDGDVVSDVRVVDGAPQVRTGKGDWRPRGDVEPYRVQLQTTWSTWDEVTELFGGRLRLVEEGTDQLAGREVRRHRVELAPAVQGVDDDAWTPLSLSGTVWIDAATAVRLKGHVEGAGTQGNRERRVTLDFERTPRVGAGARAAGAREGKAGGKGRRKGKGRGKAPTAEATGAGAGAVSNDGGAAEAPPDGAL